MTARNIDREQALEEINVGLEKELVKAEASAIDWAARCGKLQAELEQAVAREAAMEKENEELTALNERLCTILTTTTNALKGPPKELSLHSWHDLAEVATAMQNVVDKARKHISALEQASAEGRSNFYIAPKRLVILKDALEEFDRRNQ